MYLGVEDKGKNRNDIAKAGSIFNSCTVAVMEQVSIVILQLLKNVLKTAEGEGLKVTFLSDSISFLRLLK